MAARQREAEREHAADQAGDRDQPPVARGLAAEIDEPLAVDRVELSVRAPSRERWYTSTRDATRFERSDLVAWESGQMAEDGEPESFDIVGVVDARIERADDERRAQERSERDDAQRSSP